MPPKRAEAVVVDPVAAAEQLGQPEPVSTMEKTSSTQTVIDVKLEPDAAPQCALGHPNAPGTRFCGECGLSMDASAPVKADLDGARPRPVSELSDEERAARDKQHADALAAARQFENAPVDYVPAEGQTVVIHFIADGLTAFGQVWFRGQEIEIGPGHPRWEQARTWILLDRMAQVERYGKQFFERGPWPGRRSYLDGAGDFQRMYAGRDGEGKLTGAFAGPGEQALREADERERRRGRAVPGMPRA